MKLKLESGVPIPKVARRPGLIAALRTMKIGDSFTMRTQDTNLYSSAKRAGIKISQRREGTGRRVWRVA